jgi:hypothetical protein
MPQAMTTMDVMKRLDFSTLSVYVNLSKQATMHAIGAHRHCQLIPHFGM